MKGFDPELEETADFGFNLEIARQFPFWSHGELVAEHRTHGGNSSGDAGRMLTQSLVALRGQRPYTRETPELKAAYKQARRFWKGYYGELLVAQIGRSRRNGELGRALRETAILARHHPSLIPRVPGAKNRPLPS